MNLYQFNMLNTNDKLKSASKHGQYMDNFITETEKTNLNAIDKFYVDVVYDQDNYEIVEDRRFKTGECLEKSLPKIRMKY